MKKPTTKPIATMPKTIAGSKSDVVGGDVGGGNVGNGDVGDVGGGGVGGAAGGAGAQHFVEWLFVKTSKYMALSDVHPPSAKGLAQSGHGQGVPSGKQLPPVEAQQKVPVAQSPTHDATSALVVQSVAQRGKGSVMPVLSSPMQ